MVNLVTASPDVATARALADRLRARCPQVTIDRAERESEEGRASRSAWRSIRSPAARRSASASATSSSRSRRTPSSRRTRGRRSACSRSWRTTPASPGRRPCSTSTRAPGRSACSSRAAAAGGLRHRARAGRDRRRGAQRAGERDHELHVPRRARCGYVLPDLLARGVPGRRGGRRPAPRRLSPEGAPEPRHARGPRGSSTSPAIPATLARDLADLCARRLPDRRRSSPSTCSRTPRTSRSWSGSTGPPEGRAAPPAGRRPGGDSGGRWPAARPAAHRAERTTARQPESRGPRRPTSPAGRPSATSRAVPRTPSPARTPTPQAATRSAAVPQRALTRVQAASAIQRAERVDDHVAHGRHAARVEPLPELVQRRRRPRRGRRPPATARGDGARARYQRTARTPNSTTVPDLPDPEVTRRRGGPGSPTARGRRAASAPTRPVRPPDRRLEEPSAMRPIQRSGGRKRAGPRRVGETMHRRASRSSH